MQSLDLVSLFIDDCSNYVPNCWEGQPMDLWCTSVAMAHNCGSLPEMAMCWDSGCRWVGGWAGGRVGAKEGRKESGKF
jgi:hypothetical protein